MTDPRVEALAERLKRAITARSTRTVADMVSPLIDELAVGAIAATTSDTVLKKIAHLARCWESMRWCKETSDAIEDLIAATALLATRSAPGREPAMSSEAQRLGALKRDILYIVHKFAAMEPEKEGPGSDEEDESWHSWYVAAFDLMGCEIGDALESFLAQQADGGMAGDRTKELYWRNRALTAELAAARERNDFIVAACREAQEMASDARWALHAIATASTTDPKARKIATEAVLGALAPTGEAGAVALTNDDIKRIAREGHLSGELLWSGFEKDAGGTYNQPSISDSVMTLIRLVLREGIASPAKDQA